MPDLESLPLVGPDLLLVDSYHLDPVAVLARTRAQRLAVMHDSGPVPDRADLVVTTDPRLAGTAPRVVGGPDLACLGPTFWGLPDPPSIPSRVSRLIVTTGSGDPGGHAVPIAGALHTALPDAEIELVRGPYATFSTPPGVRVLDRPASLLGPLRSADLVVTAAGNSLLEALAVGTPTLAILMADNQRPFAELLAAHGGTELLEPTPLDSIALAATQAAADPAIRQDRSIRGRELIDGFGALRTSFLLWQLVHGASGPPHR